MIPPIDKRCGKAKRQKFRPVDSQPSDDQVAGQYIGHGRKKVGKPRQLEVGENPVFQIFSLCPGSFCRNQTSNRFHKNAYGTLIGIYNRILNSYATGFVPAEKGTQGIIISKNDGMGHILDTGPACPSHLPWPLPGSCSVTLFGD